MSKNYDDDLQEQPAKNSSIWTRADALKMNENDPTDGVYGFVSNEIFGPYVPLNGSALVLGNPPSQPFQTYSRYVMPSF
ncbi:glycoside hydrolase family 68 protein [Rahnella contaminans]|uniref:glycoside hydrolase family 68 protein n=1 Tax=Rahnella contaminans TaxID=2703882 RepID=UPI003C2C0462